MGGMIENIRIFMRAVETGSFSQAGRTMRLSAAVASYRIKVLEEHLGCRLITRTTRRMSPTEAGRLYYERCLDVMEALARAEAAVAGAGGAPRIAVKLTAPLGLGRRIIAPAIAAFHDTHPEIDIRLRLSDHLLDLVQEAVDLAVRMAVLGDSAFTLHKIADIERVICAAPYYLDRRGEPKTPADLLAHDCLLLRFPGSQQFRWSLGRPSAPEIIPVSGPIDTDDGDVLTDWAVAGRGLVMKPLFEVADHLAAGRLVRVLERHPPPPVTLGLIFPSRKWQSRGQRELIERLHDVLRQHVSASLARLPA
jgi:DNA-binding transcriptional LysR family regulator